MSQEFIFRPMREGDLPLCKSSWLHGFRGSHFAGPLPPPLYFKAYTGFVEYLLEECETLLAVLPEDTNEIFGFITYERAVDQDTRRLLNGVNEEHNRAERLDSLPVVHWLFVKEVYRRYGLGQALLNQVTQGPFYYTFRTGIAAKLAPKRQCWFKPNLCRFKKLPSDLLTPTESQESSNEPTR